MTKMQKMTSDFLVAEQVEKVEEALGKCEVTFLEEPHVEHGAKYDKDTYHVKVSLPNPENPEANEGVIRTWNMNGTSSDFYIEQKGWSDTKDFVGKKTEITTDLVNTGEGKKAAIYPKEYVQTAKPKARR